MKVVIYSIVGLVSAFNHPDPYRQVYQTSKEFPSDLPFVPQEEDPSPSNFPERVFEELEPQDVLLPLPSRQQEEKMYPRTRPQHDSNMQARHMMEKPPATVVQGTSVQTWTFLPQHNVDRLQVDLSTEGRPMEALVELWQGPTNVPQKLRVFSENGQKCPFSTLIEVPADYNTLAVRNIGNLQFPMGAIVVDADTMRPNFSNPLHSTRVTGGPNGYRRIQGNAMGTFNFDRDVVSLQVVLQSEGGPMSARVELTQGPSNTKQFIDIYSQDGLTYPVSLVIETPGNGKVIRIRNTAEIAFPLKAWVEPCTKSLDQKVEVVPRATEPAKRNMLPEDLGANGHPSDKKDAVDIEFQKVVMNNPTRKFSRHFDKRDNQESSPGVLPFFWAKSSKYDGGNDDNQHGHDHHQQAFPPTNGLHP
ncbi:unnamed protein product [Cylindrotheca closterium]|uniref:Uncharacterized protein n=1 Tax=Cylindrotheca closterium TaxID=2856 RepID=A0AAD2CL02_9STRA|nr:unnamed protein product [Cylindrotheca closterium]